VWRAAAAAAQPPATPTLRLEGEVRKLWDRGPHNAFTDLIRHKNRWYCAFREGEGHARGAGAIRVLASDDGDRWESAALVEEAGVDLRDPHLSAAPDGRLMLNGGAAVPPTRDPVKDHYSFVSFSGDGKNWTRPQRILGSWQWLWRVTWHKGTAYGVAYGWDPQVQRKYSAALYRSKDGVKYDKVTDFDVPQATEAALAFEGDTMLCLQRRDGKPNSAQLGTSEPPYKEWKWRDLGEFVGGPGLLRDPAGTWWAAGRLMKGGKPQTAVCRLDLKEGKLHPVLELPSGGDTSYPGLVWHEGRLWVSYYSSHEKKSNIYLARATPAK
jgi:hypothetical protein